MELRRLGRTDLTVPMLGLGTVKFGRNTHVRYPQPFRLPSDQEIRTLLDCAKDVGATLLDTAPAYGDAEQRIGALLPGPRDRWCIATKAGETYDGATSHFDFSAAHIRMSIQRSLRRLGTDYLDIVLMHTGDGDVDAIRNSPCLDALASLKQAGTIRAFGVSTKTVAGTLAALPLCDLVMLTCDPNNPDENAALDAATQIECGVFVKKALASGDLTPRQMRARLQWLQKNAGVSAIVVGTLQPSHLLAHAAALAS